MAQPKTPPLSIRISPELMAKVEAWALKEGCARNAAISLLLERGLEEDDALIVSRQQMVALKGMAAEVRAVLDAGAKPTAGTGVQLGPTTYKPGALAKTGKKA